MISLGLALLKGHRKDSKDSWSLWTSSDFWGHGFVNFCGFGGPFLALPLSASKGDYLLCVLAVILESPRGPMRGPRPKWSVSEISLGCEAFFESSQRALCIPLRFHVSQSLLAFGKWTQTHAKRFLQPYQAMKVGILVATELVSIIQSRRWLWEQNFYLFMLRTWAGTWQQINKLILVQSYLWLTGTHWCLYSGFVISLYLESVFENLKCLFNNGQNVFFCVTLASQYSFFVSSRFAASPFTDGKAFL